MYMRSTLIMLWFAAVIFLNVIFLSLNETRYLAYTVSLFNVILEFCTTAPNV